MIGCNVEQGSKSENPSCLLYAAGDARFEDRPVPQIQDPFDVILRIAYVGVCGSGVRVLRLVRN